MGFLNIFTMGELVAITMVLLQLILVTVMLRDKHLWRIRQNSEHPSAARVQLEGQKSNVDRARRSADIQLPHGSSPRNSMSSRRRFPRFIRSSRDSQALFEEHRRELDAQLAQWPRVQRGCGAAQAEVPVEPGLLGGKEPPQRPAEERPKAGVDSAAQEDRAKAAGRGSSGSLELERGGSRAMAWFIPRDVVIAEAGGSESSSSSSSLGLEFNIPTSDPWWGPVPPAAQPVPVPVPVPVSPGREPGRALERLRARLGGFLGAWWSCRRPPGCCGR